MTYCIVMQCHAAQMRTTVTIDDRLLRQATLAATKAGRTLSDLVEDGLRTLLSDRPVNRDERITLPTYGGSGLKPGIDLEDKDGLAVALDEA